MKKIDFSMVTTEDEMLEENVDDDFWYGGWKEDQVLANTKLEQLEREDG